MYTNRWDRAFQQLNQRIVELEKPYRAETIPLLTSLLQKNAAIMQFQAALDAMINDIEYAKTKSFIASPKPTAIIHWAMTLAKLIQSTYTKYSTYLAKRLWVSLIRVRINNATPDSLALVDDADLLAMGTREVELINIEKRLTKDLMAISQRKKELVHSYQQMDAKTSNTEAAQCLQGNWRNSLGSPNLAHSTLKSFINNLSTNTRATSTTGKKLQTLQNQLVRGTDDVVADCRQLISKDIDPNKLTVGAQRIRKLEQDISALELIQNEIAVLKTKTEGETVPVLRPIMVKNSPKQAKRADR